MNVAHWITAVIAIALWAWWARSEWVLAGTRSSSREGPR